MMYEILIVFKNGKQVTIRTNPRITREVLENACRSEYWYTGDNLINMKEVIYMEFERCGHD